MNNYFTCVFPALFLNRVLLDRAHSEYDSAFRHLDLEMLSSPQHSPVNQFANTSETNTSDKPFSKDLSQILVNIKSCRWRHFRPRTPPLHDSDNDELSCRKLYRSINRTGTAQPGTQTCSTSTQSKSSSGSAHFGMFICYDVLFCRNSRSSIFWICSLLYLRLKVLLSQNSLKKKKDLCLSIYLNPVCMCIHLNISIYEGGLLLFNIWHLFPGCTENDKIQQLGFQNNMKRKWTTNYHCFMLGHVSGLLLRLLKSRLARLICCHSNSE